MSVAGRTLQFGIVALVAGVALASTAVAQTAVACHMRCIIPNYGACADVTQCQNAQRACIDGCMMSLGLPQGGSAKQPAGGYGADALSADGEMLGHAKNWDTRAGAESGAVQSCQKGGHAGCKAIYSYRNRCVALGLEQGRSDDPSGLLVCRRSAGGLGGQVRCAFRMREGRFQGLFCQEFQLQRPGLVNFF